FAGCAGERSKVFVHLGREVLLGRGTLRKYPDGTLFRDSASRLRFAAASCRRHILGAQSVRLILRPLRGGEDGGRLDGAASSGNGGGRRGVRDDPGSQRSRTREAG